MSLSESNPLAVLAGKVEADPSLWTETVKLVRKPEFARDLGPGHMEIVMALFAKEPLGPEPRGFLAGALAFEMADAFQPPDASYITGLRALEERLDPRSEFREIALSMCGRLMQREALFDSTTSAAYLYLQAAKYASSNARTLLEYSEGAINRLDVQRVPADERSRASAIALEVAKLLYCFWEPMVRGISDRLELHRVIHASAKDVAKLRRLRLLCASAFEAHFRYSSGGQLDPAMERLYSKVREDKTETLMTVTDA